MATKEQLPIGKLINEPQERDAIHVAIAPVVAAESLAPGDHIGFVDDSSGELVTDNCSKPIGIVDPFLRAKVEEGQRFWMFLYPNTITSLRHNWTHPSFEQVLSGERQQSTAAVSEAQKSESLKWIGEYADHFDMTGEELIERAKNYLVTGDVLVQDGSQSWRDEFYESGDQFWNHYEIATGERVSPDDRGSPFCCTC